MSAAFVWSITTTIDMWWETVPGLITLWATATAGVVYLIRQAWRVTKLGRKLAGAVGRLMLIGTTDKWPNGAKDLPAAMNEIYKKQSETHDLLEAYIVAHRADHGLPPPEGAGF